MCPSCIVPFQETCPGTQTARCVGPETHCIYFAGNVQAGELVDRLRWGRGVCQKQSSTLPPLQVMGGRGGGEGGGPENWTKK